jgi:hypothetical protein
MCDMFRALCPCKYLTSPTLLHSCVPSRYRLDLAAIACRLSVDRIQSFRRTRDYMAWPTVLVAAKRTCVCKFFLSPHPSAGGVVCESGKGFGCTRRFGVLELTGRRALAMHSPSITPTACSSSADHHPYALMSMVGTDERKGWLGKLDRGSDLKGAGYGRFWLKHGFSGGNRSKIGAVRPYRSSRRDCSPRC